MSDAHSDARSTTSPTATEPSTDPYSRRPDESHRQWFDRIWAMKQKPKQGRPEGAADVEASTTSEARSTT